MPIKALNTFARDWIIKARISNKGDIKTTRNGGHLLKIELVDQYGTQIEGTFFNDSAKMFAEILEENKVYLFSNGNVKMANKKFTSVRNDFSIVFEKNSQIHEAKDDGSITTQAFDFCKIQDI
jgi:replication factor A1